LFSLFFVPVLPTIAKDMVVVFFTPMNSFLFPLWRYPFFILAVETSFFFGLFNFVFFFPL